MPLLPRWQAARMTAGSFGHILARPRRWTVSAWILGAWAMLTLAFLPQFYLLGRTPDFWAALWRSLSIFGLWVLLTPPVAVLVERYPMRTGAWLRHGAVLAAAGAVAIAAHALATQSLAMLWAEPLRSHGLWRLWRDGLVGLGATDVVFYLGLLAALHVQAATRRLRAQEQALAQARLTALRGQLQPHFLFNVLNALSELAYRDAARTDRLLTRLAQLLRVSLQTAGRHEHALGDELDFVRGYLEIEQAMLGDRLGVDIRMPADLADVRVPTLLLQPVVENAVRHGIAPMRRPGRLDIEARAEGDRLIVTVADTGLGRAAPAGTGTGVGLANLRARLQTLYGDRQRLSVDYPPAGGCIVRIELPGVRG